MDTMSSEYSQKWAVVAFFASLPQEYTFHRTMTPLHVTLAGVFAIEMTPAGISSIIESSVSGVKTFSITAGATERWDSLKVSRIKQSAELDRLYRHLQQTLLNHGAVFNEPAYLLDGFKTHCTYQKSGHLKPDSTAVIHSVSLVDMFPDGDWQKRRIASVYVLEGSIK
jgi:hypothetical protein